MKTQSLKEELDFNMAKNIICYICNDNLAFQEYKGPKFINEDGEKPCFECLMEAGVFEEENEDDHEC